MRKDTMAPERYFQSRALRLYSVSTLAMTALLSACGSEPGDPLRRDAASRDVLVDAPRLDAGGTLLDAGDQPVDVSSVGGAIVDGGPIDAPALEVGPADVAAIDGSSAVDGGGIDGSALRACSSLVNPLYIMTGDCQVPGLKALGKLLRHGANPVTLVWFVSPSCTIIDAVYNGTPLQQTPLFIPDDPAWDPVAGSMPSCALEPGGHAIDIGMPVGYPDSCTTQPAPSDVVAVKGPVQSLIFITPHSASPEAISSEQAALVFGTGATANIAPWLDESFYFVLKPAMAVQFGLAATIGVTASKWHGQAMSLPSELANKVAASTAPEKTIGILGGQIFDTGNSRATLKALAFQARGQSSAYLPDSRATSFDKRNLRDGHYVPWNQLVYYAKATSVDGGAREVANPTAKLVIDILSNHENPAAPAGLDPVALVAKSGIVPICAMAVSRKTEGGDLSPFSPPEPCGCYFESTVGTVPASCVACTSTTGCAAGTTCRHGFCEADDGRTSLSDCSVLPAAATHAQIINNACTAGARSELSLTP
jgi:hypothetical protein